MGIEKGHSRIGNALFSWIRETLSWGYGFVVNLTPPKNMPLFCLIFRVGKERRIRWQNPKNRWYFRAFPVCRNYTVRARIRDHRSAKWRGYQGSIRHAGPLLHWVHLDTYDHVTTAAQEEAAQTIGDVLNVV